MSTSAVRLHSRAVFGLPGEGLRGSKTGSHRWAETEPLKVSKPPDLDKFPSDWLLSACLGPVWLGHTDGGLPCGNLPCLLSLSPAISFSLTLYFLVALMVLIFFFFLMVLIFILSDTCEQTGCFLLVCRVGCYDCVLVLAIGSRKRLRTGTVF